MKERINWKILLSLVVVMLFCGTALLIAQGYCYSKGEPEPRMNIPYFYIEKDKTLHIDRNCPKIRSGVKRLPTTEFNMIIHGDYLCAGCVDDETYEMFPDYSRE